MHTASAVAVVCIVIALVAFVLAMSIFMASTGRASESKCEQNPKEPALGEDCTFWDGNSEVCRKGIVREKRVRRDGVNYTELICYSKHNDLPLILMIVSAVLASIALAAALVEVVRSRTRT